MSTATLTSHRFRSFLKEDTLSLRSFRARSSQSPTPSLKASSLKQAPRKAQPHAPTYIPTIKDLSRPSFDENDLPFAVGLPPLLPEMPHLTKVSKVSTPSAARDGSQPSRSKPKTIIRMLTTKLTSRSSSGSPARTTAPPPVSQEASAKEKRDAALRARGLLPPLPLSIQEAAQDRQIPIVSAQAASVAGSSSTSISEADRIKAEWEAKNKNKATEALQRERMANFRFGGNASSTSLNNLASPTAPNDNSDAVQPDSPLLKSSLDLPATPPSLSPPSLSSDRPPTSERPKDDPDAASLNQISGLTIPQVEAYMVPLPASPSPSKLQADTLSVISSIAMEPASPTEKPGHSTSSTSPALHREILVSDSGISTPQPQLPASSTPTLKTTGATQALLELSSSSLSSPTRAISTESTTAPAIPPVSPAPVDPSTPLPDHNQTTVPTTPTISLTPPATSSEPPGDLKSPIQSSLTLTGVHTVTTDGPVSPASSSDSDPTSPDGASITGSGYAPRAVLRSDSVEASILAPSLSSDSGTSESGVSSSAIPSFPGRSATERPGGLTLSTRVNETVPAIAESPIVGGDDWLGPKFTFDELDVVVEEPESRLGSPLPPLDTPKSKLSLAVDVDVLGVKAGDKSKSPSSPFRSSSPEPISPLTPASALSPSSPKRPEPVERRKSMFKAFKRSTTRAASAERDRSNPTSPVSPSKSRTGVFTSVKSAVGSMRRNTTGQLKANEQGAKAFDASALPASPTLPSNFASMSNAVRERSTSRDRGSQTSKDTAGAPRLAVSPQMYNRGSILIEASAIEDEEMRRMTELAFLG